MMDTTADPFIAERIPHRPPFLWLDRVVAIDEAAIRAEKTLPEDLDVFRGHYPGYPLLPGVLLCEAVFQAGAVLLGTLALTEGVFGDYRPPGSMPRKLPLRRESIMRCGRSRGSRVVK